jgi:choline-glycine betaine transporter
VATASTISGISAGIRRLSEVAFVMGLFIMTLVLFMDKTSYLLNLFVQSIGVYFQNIIHLGWHTDAFEQLGPSSGNLERNRHVPENIDSTDGPKDWMDNWTFFYWGWWISFTPFCCK